MSTTDGQRLFELYVDQMTGDSQQLDELLIVRLRLFGEDVEKTMERLKTDPALSTELVHQLSAMMQALDSAAGAADEARRSVSEARRWALLFPEVGSVEEPSQ